MIDNDVTTKSDLVKIFQEVGLTTGVDVMVHSSMKSLGYVVNGAIDVVDALIEVVGQGKGTILMPAHTGQLTEPKNWNNPSVPEGYIEEIKKYMRPFDKVLTPVRNRGVIPSQFLSYSGIQRSNHPLNSVSALGRLSRYYTEKHDFDEPEGAESPVGRLYSNDGKILLINVGLTSCTAIHLAEYIADVEYLYRDNPVVLRGKVDGVNEFVSIKKYPGVSEYFDNIIPDLKAKHLIKENNFKQGRLMLFSIRPVVDYIVSELNSNSEYLITKNIRKD